MQDYKLVVRGITSGPTVAQEGQVVIQNASEFQSYLNENYLSQGYELKSESLLRVIPPNDQGFPYPVYEFAYHLVKEYKGKAEKVESKE